MHKRVSLACCFFVLTAALAWSLVGASADEQKEPPPPKVVTEFYGIADFLAEDSNSSEVPNLRDDLGRPSGGMGAGYAGPRPTKTDEDKAQEIIKMIEDCVGPETWRESGGTLGSIRYARRCLIISHTEEFHRQIKQFLLESRSALAQPLRVRAHWVLSDRTQLEKILTPFRDGGTAATAPTSKPTDVSSDAAWLVVDPADLEKLAGPHLRGELICTSGHRVFVTAAQFQSVLRDANPSVGLNVAAFDPDISELAKGLVLVFQADMVDGGRSVMATLRSQWKDLRVNPESLPVPLGPVAHATTRRVVAEPQQPILLDRAASRIFDLQTCTRLPTGRMVLVGGMTLDPASALKEAPPAKPGGGAATRPQLYLFVEVSAH